MVGCCQGLDCAFETFCYDSSKVSATPSLTSAFDAFGMYCTDSSAPACISYTYPDLGVQEFGCGATSDISSLYLTASPFTVTGSTEFMTDVRTWTVSDEFLDTYTSSWSSRYGSTTAPKETGLSSGSATATSGGTLTGSFTGHTATTSASSSSSSSSSNTGAIVGGVIGGVGGAALIAGALGFFWLRRRKQQQKRNATADAAGDGYQAVPGNQPPPPAWETQPPAEMEGNFASQRYAEVQGDTPEHGVLGAAGMQGKDKHEVHEMDSGNVIAELPTDYDVKNKTEGGHQTPNE